ncbi:MAG: acyltransferase [Planctomycetes bacterium]|nr:acyltransferase [Planctomycetota bacterium]
MANLIQAILRKILTPLLRPAVEEIVHKSTYVWGPQERLKIAKGARLVNSLLNTSSGTITIGDQTFTGHSVSILTGTHDYSLQMADRMKNFPKEGGDIVIGKGVWIGSNAVLLGPCSIADHAVIAAGAIVTAGSEIPEGGIAVGVPARVVKTVK